MMFADRKDAGKKLAERLAAYAGKKDVLVLGLARGGILVAYEIAKALELPLDVLVPRKIGAPGIPELAIGAIAEGDQLWLNQAIIKELSVSPAYLQEEIEEQQRVMAQRLTLYRRNKPLLHLQGKTVILVDDGIATGATMLVEIQHLRKMKVSKIILAVPVSATVAWEVLSKQVDESVSLLVASDFGGISNFYHNFSQTTDAEVISCLN